LADYARERLGISARTLQSAAWVATRLDALPLTGSAFDRGELSWAQVRALSAVAGKDDEREWLARAQCSSAEELEALARSVRPEGARDPDPDGDDDSIDGEPAVRFRLACPARVRALWRRALELASRTAGEPLIAWRGAEAIAAEAFAGRPDGASFGDRALLVAVRLARRARRLAKAAEPGAETSHPATEPSIAAANAVSAPGASEAGASIPGASCATSGSGKGFEARTTCADSPAIGEVTRERDAFALDARLASAMRAIQTAEPRIGRLLRLLVDHRLYRTLDFTSVDAYVRERLGLSSRKAWAILKVERTAHRAVEFARSYEDGRLSWVRALTLLPVLDPENAGAWVARATSVTVRRLADEVSWVLEARDALGPCVSLDPPPLDSDLSPALVRPAARECQNPSPWPGLQIGARREEVCDAEVRFVGPASVVALLRDALDAFARPDEPRWAALEHVLRHVIAYWEATPRYRDPIFERDGWRCSVPACSSRRNLHDHHLRYRSRGGGNDRGNRITICASHHLYGIHAGVIEAWGVAPRRVHWRLGVRRGAPPLLATVGDRLCASSDS
jgi:hypothetical protein